MDVSGLDVDAAAADAVAAPLLNHLVRSPPHKNRSHSVAPLVTHHCVKNKLSSSTPLRAIVMLRVDRSIVLSAVLPSSSVAATPTTATCRAPQLAAPQNADVHVPRPNSRHRCQRCVIFPQISQQHLFCLGRLNRRPLCLGCRLCGRHQCASAAGAPAASPPLPRLPRFSLSLLHRLLLGDKRIGGEAVQPRVERWAANEREGHRDRARRGEDDDEAAAVGGLDDGVLG